MTSQIDNSDFEERFQRYGVVFSQVCERETFLLADLHKGCDKHEKAFRTRVVNELVDSGWVLRESPTTDENDPAQCSLRWNKGRGEFPKEDWLRERITGTQIKAGPVESRPREKLLEIGAASLSLRELLAILIRSGRPGESAVRAGEKLATQFERHLLKLASSTRAELKAISSAVDVTAFCQIMAGIELGRRVAALRRDEAREPITTPAMAIDYCRREFERLARAGVQEEFHVVTLNTKNIVIDTYQITVGTLDASLVHPREAFRPAIRDSAAAVILVHNHPSGDPTPSQEDFAVTRRLEQAGDVLGIRVLDHVVLGRDRAVSIRELR